MQFIEGVDGLMYPASVRTDPTWALQCQARADRAAAYLERKGNEPRAVTTCARCSKVGRFLRPNECAWCAKLRIRLDGSNRRAEPTVCRTCHRVGRWHRHRHCKVCAREQRRIANRTSAK